MEFSAFAAMLSSPKNTIIGQEADMDSVIEHLPAKALEKLDRKAKASGRSIEAEAAAILAASLEDKEELVAVDDMDDLQRMVWEAYGRKLPGNAVEELLAERRLEAKAEAEKLG
jgi:plasmid stability protein